MFKPYFSGDLVLRKDPEATDDGRSEWEGHVDPGLSFDPRPGETIWFAKGCRTDLGSIPQFAWSLGFPPDGQGDPAYVIHDLLYRTKGTCERDGRVLRTRAAAYTRAEADEILRIGLIACGVSEWRARLIWLAVRFGGSGGWGR